MGSAWTWSGSPAVVRRARLQGWMVAADAPTGFQRVQPLLQAADDLVQRPGPALAMSKSFWMAVATWALLTISILAMSSSL